MKRIHVLSWEWEICRLCADVKDIFAKLELEYCLIKCVCPVDENLFRI